MSQGDPIYCGDFVFKIKDKPFCFVEKQVYKGETAVEALSDNYTFSTIRSKLSGADLRKIRLAQKKRNLEVEIINRIHVGFANKKR